MTGLDVFKQADWVEPENRFVFWSGGEDSTVALHLALQAWKDPEVVFIDTGITIPETLEYIKTISERMGFEPTILRPEIDFWEYVAYAGFPMAKTLWCRRLLKMQPIRKFYKKKYGWKVQVLGIRRAESSQRRKSRFYRKPFQRHIKLRFVYNLLPVLSWNRKQVRDYMRRHEIPTNPAYKHFGTSGCYYCPFVKNRKHYLALKRLHPDLFKQIVNAENNLRVGHSSLWSHKAIFVREIGKQQFLEVSK